MPGLQNLKMEFLSYDLILIQIISHHKNHNKSAFYPHLHFLVNR